LVGDGDGAAWRTKQIFSSNPEKIRFNLKNFNFLMTFLVIENKRTQNRLGGAPTKYRHRRRTDHQKSAQVVGGGAAGAGL